MSRAHLLLVLCASLSCLGCPGERPGAADPLVLAPEHGIPAVTLARADRPRPAPTAQKPYNPLATATPAPRPSRSPQPDEPIATPGDPSPLPTATGVAPPDRLTPKIPRPTFPDVRGNRPKPRRTYGPDPVFERLKELGSTQPPTRRSGKGGY